MATLRLGGQTFTLRATVGSLARARAAGVDLLGSPADIMSALGDLEKVVVAAYAIVQPQGVTPAQWAEWFDSDTSTMAAQKAMFEALSDFSTAHRQLLRSMGDKMEQVHQQIKAQSQELAGQIQSAPIGMFSHGEPSTNLPERQELIQRTSNSGNSSDSTKQENKPPGDIPPA